MEPPPGFGGLSGGVRRPHLNSLMLSQTLPIYTGVSWGFSQAERLKPRTNIFSTQSRQECPAPDRLNVCERRVGTSRSVRADPNLPCQQAAGLPARPAFRSLIGAHPGLGMSLGPETCPNSGHSYKLLLYWTVTNRPRSCQVDGWGWSPRPLETNVEIQTKISPDHQSSALSIRRAVLPLGLHTLTMLISQTIVLIKFTDRKGCDFISVGDITLQECNLEELTNRLSRAARDMPFKSHKASDFLTDFPGWSNRTKQAELPLEPDSGPKEIKNTFHFNRPCRMEPGVQRPAQNALLGPGPGPGLEKGGVPSDQLIRSGLGTTTVTEVSITEAKRWQVPHPLHLSHEPCVSLGRRAVTLTRVSDLGRAASLRLPVQAEALFICISAIMFPRRNKSNFLPQFSSFNVFPFSSSAPPLLLLQFLSIFNLHFLIIPSTESISLHRRNTSATDSRKEPTISFSVVTKKIMRERVWEGEQDDTSKKWIWREGRVRYERCLPGGEQCCLQLGASTRLHSNLGLV
ncbi:hypothetical protein RRG08_018971 [Elysia crispata]|uniref:Uncharacterized protein n=1 Tax=Elysia crispata TaxID=231223 RepID=A0AAE1A5A8_9GAST|nr:hypothetical protein RRG08_018971 [Elysia crispata]